MVVLIILLVVFVMAMFMLAVENSGKREWLTWICLAVLGVVVFLLGSGVIVVQRTTI